MSRHKVRHRKPVVRLFTPQTQNATAPPPTDRKSLKEMRAAIRTRWGKRNEFTGGPTRSAERFAFCIDQYSSKGGHTSRANGEADGEAEPAGIPKERKAYWEAPPWEKRWFQEATACESVLHTEGLQKKARC